MNVLLYVSSLSLSSGGPSRSVPMMAKGLSEAGIDVFLMTRYSDDMNTHSLDGTNVRFITLKDGFNSKEIEKFIIKEQVDVVQLQSIWSLDYHKLAKICRKHHIPYLITPRGMLEPWSLSQKKWKKNLAMFLYQRRDLNHASCIYTTSELEAQNVYKLGIKIPRSVIPNGIETDAYPCRLNSTSVKKQILFLSRIHEKKGIELLIDAWNKIGGDYPYWNVKIVGNGDKEYINQLKTKVANLNLSRCIEILPPVFGQEKIELYQSSALFVLPSYSENFGMVVAEALSCGVPVITSEYTPWDFLNKEKAGWYIKLSIEDMTSALREALNKPLDDLLTMGQNGAKLVRNKFDYRSVAQQTISLYKWISEGGVKPAFVNCDNDSF